MKKPKPYKYRVRSPGVPDYSGGASLNRVGEKEVFTGVVQGKKASDLEERFARSLEKNGIGFEFRVRISSMIAGARRLTKVFANLPGEVEIDALVQHDRTIPVMIDGFIGHMMAPWQQERDQEKTAIVNDFGKQFGWQEVVRIPFTELETQTLSDWAARKLLS